MCFGACLNDVLGAYANARSRESKHSKHSAVDRLSRSANADKLPSQRSIHTALPESRKSFTFGEVIDV